ncbi:MAG: hypothetical protein HRU15_04690, partial [Planctomycetes bacterium]|nr:hypothetical protein [Planctomycetota bacterium]
DGEEMKVPVGMSGGEANVVSADTIAQPSANKGLPIALPKGMDVQSIMKMMSDPRQAGKLREMAKDPRYSELLKDPAIREFIRNAMGGK